MEGAPPPLPPLSTLGGCFTGTHHARNCACGVCEKCNRPDDDFSNCDREHRIRAVAGRPRKSATEPKPKQAPRRSTRTVGQNKSYDLSIDESVDTELVVKHASNLMIARLQQKLNEAFQEKVGNSRFRRVHKYSLEALETESGRKQCLALFDLARSVTLDVLSGGNTTVQQQILELHAGATKQSLTRATRITATQIKVACDFIEAQCMFGMSWRKHRNILTGQLSNYLHRSHSLRWLWEQYKKLKDADGLIDGEKPLGRGKLKRIVRAITKMMGIKAGVSYFWDDVEYVLKQLGLWAERILQLVATAVLDDMIEVDASMKKDLVALQSLVSKMKKVPFALLIPVP
jgi:hypothetical protein